MLPELQVAHSDTHANPSGWVWFLPISPPKLQEYMNAAHIVVRLLMSVSHLQSVNYSDIDKTMSINHV